MDKASSLQPCFAHRQLQLNFFKICLLTVCYSSLWNLQVASWFWLRRGVLIEQVCSAGWHVDKAVATFSLSSLGLLCPTSTATSNKLCPTSWIGRQKWEEGKKLLWEIYSHLRTPGFNAKVELLLLLYNMQTHLTHYRLVYLIFGMMYLVFGVVYLTFGQTLWLSKRWRKVMQKNA